MAGSNLRDDHKTFFAGKSFKTDGDKNTSGQFESKKNRTNKRISIRKIVVLFL
jgi:isocitrate lyase